MLSRRNFLTALGAGVFCAATSLNPQPNNALSKTTNSFGLSTQQNKLGAHGALVKLYAKPGEHYLGTGTAFQKPDHPKVSVFAAGHLFTGSNNAKLDKDLKYDSRGHLIVWAESAFDGSGRWIKVRTLQNNIACNGPNVEDGVEQYLDYLVADMHLKEGESFGMPIDIDEVRKAYINQKVKTEGNFFAYTFSAKHKGKPAFVEGEYHVHHDNSKVSLKSTPHKEAEKMAPGASGSVIFDENGIPIAIYATVQETEKVANNNIQENGHGVPFPVALEMLDNVNFMQKNGVWPGISKDDKVCDTSVNTPIFNGVHKDLRNTKQHFNTSQNYVYANSNVIDLDPNDL